MKITLIAWFLIACFSGMPCSCFAQDFFGQQQVNVPGDENELPQAEKLITDQPLPPAASVYPAQTEASNKVSALQSYIDNVTSQRDTAKRVQVKFPQQLEQAKEAAKKCDNPAQVSGLIRAQIPLSINLGPIPDKLSDLFAQAGPYGSKTICTKMLDASYVSNLQTATDDYLTGVQKQLGTRISNATRLKDDWQKRLNALNEEAKTISGKQSTTQNLVSNLPWIVLILCAFSIGMFAALRLFGPAIQMELVSSGQVIQFPTVMILLVVIVSLGLVGILTESSLSALLGGLAGYVLSQGIGRAAARAGQGNKAGSLSISPSVIAFPDTAVNTNSAAQTVSVSNNGTASSNVSISISGDFTETNDLQGSLPQGDTATITIIFAPTTVGNRVGSLTIKDGPNVQTVKLAGKGI